MLYDVLLLKVIAFQSLLVIFKSTTSSSIKIDRHVADKLSVISIASLVIWEW